MDAKDQAAGERKVREMLIDPLLRRGLMKPKGMPTAQFNDMLDDICARLAYMSNTGLAALEEHCAEQPGGSESDRFPMGKRVLDWAGQIEPPPDSDSALIRAIFAHETGARALAEGWAPELLRHVRRKRLWPAPFVQTKLRDDARRDIRDYSDIEAALARGEEISPEQAAFRARRKAALDRCAEIARMGVGA